MTQTAQQDKPKPVIEQIATFTAKPDVFASRLARKKLGEELTAQLDTPLEAKLGKLLADEVINTFYRFFGYTQGWTFVDDLSRYPVMEEIRALWTLGTQHPVDWIMVYEYYANEFSETAQIVWLKKITDVAAARKQEMSDLFSPRHLQPASQLTDGELNDEAFLAAGKPGAPASGSA